MADCSHSQTLSCAMDFFWFYHNIISPKPTSALHQKSMELVDSNPELLIADLPLISEDLCLSSPKSQEAEIDGECTRERPSRSVLLREDKQWLAESQEAEVDGECIRSMPSSLEMVREDEPGSPESCSRSHSSSDSSPLSTSSKSSKLRKGKIRSSKSLTELEHDELKGFMDLGFTFKKEELNPRMLSMIPGLQRLDGNKKQRSVEERMRDKIARPYLSEAWLINRPDSPLLNLRIPRVATAGSDMKKHLKFWARTVASEIQQVS